jgi:hypothetical protein
MRTGETPHASIDDGYQHGLAVLMAVMSYDIGKNAMYDRAKRAIVTTQVPDKPACWRLGRAWHCSVPA